MIAQKSLAILWTRKWCGLPELLLIILNLLTFYFGDEFDHGLVVGLIKYFGLGIDVPIQT